MDSGRRFLDLRRVEESDCLLTISGQEDEVLRAALGHELADHDLADAPHLRIALRSAMDVVQPLLPTPGRKVLDCRDLRGEEVCTLSFIGPPKDVVCAAMGHLARFHNERATTERVDELLLSLKELPTAATPWS
ncbi:MAG TPA: hypothetical protein VGK67_21940 [Myxococcales bacterium]|jgi:hypothetical protein